MGQTRKQAEEAGASDAQAVVERLKSDLTEMRIHIAELKHTSATISEIRNSMVTLDAIDVMMQKYMSISTSPGRSVNQEEGDDPIGWLQQCEKFFDMSGTPYEQWMNLATGHFFGRANVWLKNICIPWQMVSWQQFYHMIADRFTQANAYEEVEKLKNLQQYLFSGSLH